MASPAEKELFESLIGLRNAYSDGFERFLRALSVNADEVTVAVTEAPNDDILAAKGRAQNARRFLRLCTEAYRYNRPAS